MKENDVVKNIREKVVIYYSHQGKKFRISTGVDWKKGDEHENKKKWKSLEDKMRTLITQYVVNDPKGKNPPVEWLQREMERPEEKENNTLMEWYETFYDGKKNLDRVEKGTLKGYENLRTALYDFERTLNHPLQFEDISPDFFAEFQAFLSKPREKDKGSNNSNTIQKRMVCLKTFMKYIEETKEVFKFSKEVKDYSGFAKTYKINSVVLSAKELKFIYLLPLKLKMQEQIRDLFILQCMTGLRYSDLHDLTKYDINSGVIEREAIKTRDELRIPLNDIAIEIFEKYNYELPKYESQVVNRVIKDILKDKPEFQVLEQIKTKYYNKETVVETVEKWTLISTHTARRTFITNSILEGLIINDIMKMTGHQKLETLQVYIEKYKPVSKADVNRLNFMKSSKKSPKK